MCAAESHGFSCHGHVKETYGAGRPMSELCSASLRNRVCFQGKLNQVICLSLQTAISYMAGNGAAAMLELALSFEGVDPNLPDNEGNTPLHFAAQAGEWLIILWISSCMILWDDTQDAGKILMTRCGNQSI